MLRSFLTLIFFLILFDGLAAQTAAKNETLMSDEEINRQISSLARQYQLDSATLAAFDKIITYEKEVYAGKIYNITFTDVRFTCPPDDHLVAVNKSRISQILYADGRRDVFIPLEGREVKQKELVDTSKIIIKNQKDWMKVIITEDPSDVTQLTLLGHIKANYEAEVGSASNDELMRQAGIILKKRAALIKAHCVLIETKFFKKSYGDLPRVEVTGRAFGYR